MPKVLALLVHQDLLEILGSQETRVYPVNPVPKAYPVSHLPLASALMDHVSFVPEDLVGRPAQSDPLDHPDLSVSPVHLDNPPTQAHLVDPATQASKEISDALEILDHRVPLVRVERQEEKAYQDPKDHLGQGDLKDRWAFQETEAIPVNLDHPEPKGHQDPPETLEDLEVPAHLDVLEVREKMPSIVPAPEDYKLIYFVLIFLYNFGNLILRYRSIIQLLISNNMRLNFFYFGCH